MSFSIKENFKAIQWGPTLGLHLMRAFSAGLVWTIVLLASGSKGPDGQSAIFTGLVIIPACIFGLPPFLMMGFKFMSFFVGGLEWMFGLYSLVAALGVTVGDPILFLLNKVKVGILPVEKFNFFNFSVMLFVLDPNKQ